VARILLIDDDPWVLKVFQQFLEDQGHEIITAVNGQEGLDLFRQNPTDLIITDMVMPIKDGLKMILELDNEFPNIPTIAISGGGVIEPERYLNLAESIGARKTLTKPVTKEELLAAVKEVLN
jgi:YesN/AraC family two-component response regulator